MYLELDFVERQFVEELAGVQVTLDSAQERKLVEELVEELQDCQ